MALYQLKPASKSLFIEHLGADKLPYAWIGTALSMGVLIAGYHRLVERFQRFTVVQATLLLCTGLLIFFRFLMENPSHAGVVAFFIFVDILGVILVEQFWSLTNSIYSTAEGKKWYGIVGTGGLSGGIAGGAFAAFLIKKTALTTPDLLLVAASILSVILVLNNCMNHIGMYCEVEMPAQQNLDRKGWRILGHSRYLLLIASILLLAQLASPIIEYQFLKTVEGAYINQEARTAFLSLFFSALGIVSICVNLILTPLVHRGLGVIAGLLVQPVMMSICSGVFLMHTTLFTGSATKISDRGLSYSINRASKELLYVPVDPILIYQAKAWIDMFGYRTFKIFSSFIILALTQWLPFQVNVSQLSWLTMGICTLWILMIFSLRFEYQKYERK